MKKIKNFFNLKSKFDLKNYLSKTIYNNDPNMNYILLIDNSQIIEIKEHQIDNQIQKSIRDQEKNTILVTYKQESCMIKAKADNERNKIYNDYIKKYENVLSDYWNHYNLITIKSMQERTDSMLWAVNINMPDLQTKSKKISINHHSVMKIDLACIAKDRDINISILNKEKDIKLSNMEKELDLKYKETDDKYESLLFEIAYQRDIKLSLLK